VTHTKQSQAEEPPPSATRAGGVAAVAAYGRALRDLVGRPAFWVIALGLAFLIPLGRAIAHSGPLPPPPAMSMPLPAFRLTDQHGRPYGSEELRGRVWVADFIFTSCPTACPKLTKRMQEVQHRSRNLGDAFHLVSFTVDPENDTPERLAAYATRNHASTRWAFLTGSNADVEATVVKGFKIAMGKEPASADGNIMSIFHGEKLVLVDARGNIRGYYDATDDGLDDLMRDTGRIVNSP
jgi:protein SCO1/2